MQKIKSILINLFKYKTISEIISALCIAFLVRYLIIHFELSVINSIFWIKSHFLFIIVTLIIIIGRKIINLTIDTLNISKEPFRFIIKMDNYFNKNNLNYTFFKNNMNLKKISKTKIINQTFFFLFSLIILCFIIIYSIYYRVSNLIGKEFPCRGNRCRVEAGLTRKNWTYV